MVKEGYKNFKFEIIERCPLDKLDEREEYWIKEYDSLNTGYNMLAGFRTDKVYKEGKDEEV